MKKLINTDSLVKLINKGFTISDEEAKGESIGFTARSMVLATLPHSKPKSNTFVRKNGNYTLEVMASSKHGLPYGTLPRLFLAWVTTEAVRTKQRRIILGDSLSKFMQELEIIPTGGRWGSITRIKDQMNRLFYSTFLVSYSSNECDVVRKISPVEEAQLWWQVENPKQASLWQSSVLLGEAFFNEIISRPIPIDKRALLALKKSPMALDIYLWLTYRHSFTEKPSPISWDALQLQFGADYERNSKGLYAFKKNFGLAYKKVKLVYEEAKLEIDDRGVTVLPSVPHIKKLNKK